MKITLSSVMVDDQAKALKFYTEVLGFVKKLDLPAGEYRWLTVASLRKLGVVFRSKPTQLGPVTTAVFEDTCGNLIQPHQT